MLIAATDLSHKDMREKSNAWTWAHCMSKFSFSHSNCINSLNSSLLQDSTSLGHEKLHCQSYAAAANDLKLCISLFLGRETYGLSSSWEERGTLICLTPRDISWENCQKGHACRGLVWYSCWWRAPNQPYPVQSNWVPPSALHWTAITAAQAVLALGLLDPSRWCTCTSLSSNISSNILDNALHGTSGADAPFLELQNCCFP